MAKINVGIIGAGMFGGSVVKAGSELGIPGIVMNASKDDIEALMLDGDDNVYAFVVGDGRGTGKNRDIAMQFLLDHAQIFEDKKIDDLIQSSDLIIIAGSAGGGFGSGVVPATVQILNERYEGKKLLIPLTVLPDTSEMYTAQKHAECFLREILSQEVPYIIYDNEKYKGATASDMYKGIIETIKRDLKVLRGDFIVDVEEGSNMDPRDLLTTASVPGRIVIGSCDPFTGTGDVVMSVKEAIDKSAHAQLETDKVIIASAMMYNLPEDTLTANGQKIKTEMQQVFGEHVTDYRNEATYNGLGNQFVATIITGLTSPNTRINQIIDLRKKTENVITSRKATTNKLFSEGDSAGIKLGVKTFGGTPVTDKEQSEKPSVSDIVKKMQSSRK